MLKASFPGNVYNVLIERVFRIQRQRQVSCPCYRWAHSSSFSARFAARFPSDAAELDSHAVVKTVEGGSSEAISTHLRSPVPPGEAIGEKEERRRLRSIYLPWAFQGLTTPLRGSAGERKRNVNAGRRKQSVKGRATCCSEDRQHRVKPGTQERREESESETPACLQSKEGEGEGENVAAVGVEKLDRGQDSCDSPETSTSTTTQPCNSIESIVDDLGKDIEVEDLSILQLQAIVLDKRQDLMGLVWDAYQRLVTIDAEEKSVHGIAAHGGTSLFGTELLTTLANRLVARRKYNRKHCREIFLRLLSVYARLRRERAVDTGGVPYLRTIEWNCLIHFAGTGLRGKASLEAYNAALDVYDDMLRGIEDAKQAGAGDLLKEISPDIYTYTSLLNIALSSEHQPAMDHAMQLLRESGEEPTRVTRLCMIHYRYRFGGGLAGVRDLLNSLAPEEIGADGVTAYMMCAGNEGDLDCVRNIYKTLRRSLEMYDDGTYGPRTPIHELDERTSEESESDFNAPATASTQDTEGYITVEGIRLPCSLVPSEAVYNCTIQIFSYHGRLTDALTVFTEMLATRNPDARSCFFQPNYAAFRGLFLGFFRHSYRQGPGASPTSLSLDSEDVEWDWERFSVILDTFIELGDKITPSERMVYWIMTAARRMTDGNERVLREVWQRLNERWNIRKGGRLKALDTRYGRREDEADSREE